MSVSAEPQADAESPPAGPEIENPSEEPRDDTPVEGTDGDEAGEDDEQVSDPDSTVPPACGEADASAEACPDEVAPAEDVAGEPVTVP